jgi:CheY-like chemotaxis protein
MTRPRLLLVEDDPSIRRFVAMALEDEAVDVVPAAGLAQAREALKEGPFGLVMCDLMLPDGNGLELLRELLHPAAGDARIACVAFSAGISAEVHQQLLQAGVFQVLGKPVALAELVDCTRRALSAAATPDSPRALPASCDEATPLAPVPAPSPPAASANDVAAAVAHYFGGDFKLYVDFDRRCREQFGADLNYGDRALASADLAALRRLAHSLKSVLQSLGHGGASALSALLEVAAEQEKFAEAKGLWEQLAGWLRVQATA